jgi:hypothetical protein
LRRKDWLLDLLVDEDAQEDADEGEEVHLQGEPESDFQQPEIERHRRCEAGMDGLGEEVLNDAGMEERAEGFAEQAAEQTADYDAGDQDPGRFTQAATSCPVYVSEETIGRTLRKILRGSQAKILCKHQ